MQNNGSLEDKDIIRGLILKIIMAGQGVIDYPALFDSCREMLKCEARMEKNKPLVPDVISCMESLEKRPAKKRKRKKS
jgi:hypothetical protein